MMQKKLNLSAYQQINTGGGKPLNKKISLNCYIDVEETLDPYSFIFFITAKHPPTKSNIVLKMTVTESDLNHEINNYLNNKIVAYPCYPISNKIEKSMSEFMKTGKTPTQLDLISWMLNRSEIQLYNKSNTLGTENGSRNAQQLKHNDSLDDIDDDLRYKGNENADMGNNDDDEENYLSSFLSNTGTSTNKLKGDICFGGFGELAPMHVQTTAEELGLTEDYESDNDYNIDTSINDLDSSISHIQEPDGDNKIKTMKDFFRYNTQNTQLLKQNHNISATGGTTRTLYTNTKTIAIQPKEMDVDGNFILHGVKELEKTGKEIKETLIERKNVIEIDKIRKQQKLQKLETIKANNNTAINLGVTSSNAGKTMTMNNLTLGAGTGGLYVSKDPDKKMVNDILNNHKLQDLIEHDVKKQKAKSQREQQMLLWTKAPWAYPILRGKYKKGAYLGAGPLPSQLVHPFQFIDTHESDVYYDTDGRKHMKQIGDEQDITLALEATQGVGLDDPDQLTKTAAEAGVDQEVLQAAMQQFKDDTKTALLTVKRAAANVAAYKLSLKQIFERIDVEDEGFLPIGELSQLFRNLGIRVDLNAQESMLRYFDPYSTGVIYFYDFLWAFFNRKKLVAHWGIIKKRYSAKQIDFKFQNCVDKSSTKDGTVTMAEMVLLLTSSFHMKLEIQSHTSLLLAASMTDEATTQAIALGNMNTNFALTSSSYKDTLRSIKTMQSVNQENSQSGNDDSDASILFNQFDRTGEGFIDIYELRYFLDNMAEYKYLLHIIEKTGRVHIKRKINNDDINGEKEKSWRDELKDSMQQTQAEQRLLSSQQRLSMNKSKDENNRNRSRSRSANPTTRNHNATNNRSSSQNRSQSVDRNDSNQYTTDNNNRTFAGTFNASRRSTSREHDKHYDNSQDNDYDNSSSARHDDDYYTNNTTTNNKNQLDHSRGDRYRDSILNPQSHSPSIPKNNNNNSNNSRTHSNSPFSRSQRTNTRNNTDHIVNTKNDNPKQHEHHQDHLIAGADGDEYSTSEYAHVTKNTLSDSQYDPYTSQDLFNDPHNDDLLNPHIHTKHNTSNSKFADVPIIDSTLSQTSPYQQKQGRYSPNKYSSSTNHHDNVPNNHHQKPNTSINQPTHEINENHNNHNVSSGSSGDTNNSGISSFWYLDQPHIDGGLRNNNNNTNNAQSQLNDSQLPSRQQIQKDNNSGLGSSYVRNKLYNHTVTGQRIVDDDYINYYKNLVSSASVTNKANETIHKDVNKANSVSKENVYEDWMSRLLDLQHDIEHRLKVKHDILGDTTITANTTATVSHPAVTVNSPTVPVKPSHDYRHINPVLILNDALTTTGTVSNLDSKLKARKKAMELAEKSKRFASPTRDSLISTL